MLRCIRSLFVLMLLALPQAAQAGESGPYRVGTWKTAQTIQPFLYERFSPRTSVTVHPFTNPGDQKAALLAGSLDMTGTTLALAIQAASRGEPVVLVAALCDRCSALVVRKDSGMTSVKDLAGKRIAYVPGTMHEILLREALARAGLDPARDVTLVRVDFFDMGTALAKGDIDAFLSGEPLPAQAVLQGYGEILAYPYFDDAIGPINAGLIVRRDTLDKHPEDVAALVAAHVRTTRALAADRAWWLAEASRRFGVDPAVLAAAANNMELVWDMDEIFVRRLAALGARMKALDLIEREPDYAALVDARFVARLRSE
uniref:ABC-type nitrate/sulfonate/bicarbonate transport system, periplasmic component n=1 Tax=Desulfovibrio sp. U5L TaxID=596152 RepID=I2Q6V0_9BACT